MLDFEHQVENSYSHEAQLYQRIAVLENELANSNKKITELEGYLKTSDKRIDRLFKTNFQVIFLCICLLIMLGIFSSYLLFF